MMRRVRVGVISQYQKCHFLACLLDWYKCKRRKLDGMMIRDLSHRFCIVGVSFALVLLLDDACPIARTGTPLGERIA